MMYVNDESNHLDVPDVFHEIEVFQATAVDGVSYARDVPDGLDESDIFTVTDVPDSLKLLISTMSLMLPKY
jgi:hypothetical protein